MGFSQWMLIYLKTNPAKFIPIWFETTEPLGFLQGRCNNSKTIWDNRL